MTAPSHLGTILVVEDECLVRLDAAEILRTAGFEVVEAADAGQALDVLAHRSDIDLLFTDINMPGELDGIELARRIRRSRPAIHVLLTSGHVRPDRADLPDGAFLPKPYSPESMTRTVYELMAA